jgi:hypothetical protein
MSDIDQVILELKYLGEVAEVEGMTVEGNALHPIINMGWQALERLRAEVASLKDENARLKAMPLASDTVRAAIYGEAIDRLNLQIACRKECHD